MTLFTKSRQPRRSLFSTAEPLRIIYAAVIRKGHCKSATISTCDEVPAKVWTARHPAIIIEALGATMNISIRTLKVARSRQWSDILSHNSPLCCLRLAGQDLSCRARRGGGRCRGQTVRDEALPLLPLPPRQVFHKTGTKVF